MQDPIYQRSLEKALTLKGSAEAPAQHLQVPRERLQVWQRGEEAIPGRICSATLRAAATTALRGVSRH